VAICDIQVDAGQSLAGELGGIFIRHDVTKENDWQTTVGAVVAHFGALHILVNNAAITGPMDRVTPEDVTLSDWRTIHQINVEGIVLGCRAAIPALRKAGGGTIINMSSIAALVGMPDGVAYGASKAAVRHITKSVALHCARDRSRIRCNSIHPGNILTPMLRQVMEGIATRRGVSYDTVLQEFKDENPQGELQDPEDIANAVLFLASDEARHITGIKLVVDGGTTLSSG
jgi:3(or 17)beta-hydroxysteroid dehydrogenase